MGALSRTRPVAGSAQASDCVPPIHMAPPARVGTEGRPPPAPWVTGDADARSPPGANHTHSLIPDPTVPQTPAEVAIRLPPTPTAILDTPTCTPPLVRSYVSSRKTT